MSPQYFRSDVFSSRCILSSNSVVCCLLMQILCVVSRKKLQLLGDLVPQTSYQGSAPGPRWGTEVPQTPSLLLCPPSNPVGSTPLLINIAALNHFRHITNTKSVQLQGALPPDQGLCPWTQLEVQLPDPVIDSCSVLAIWAYMAPNLYS